MEESIKIYFVFRYELQGNTRFSVYKIIYPEIQTSKTMKHAHDAFRQKLLFYLFR